MYKAGDMIEVREGVTVRLNTQTAEIANAAIGIEKKRLIDDFMDDYAKEQGE